MNTEYKDLKKTDVAERNSNWNPVDSSGRVHDRWFWKSNPNRCSFIGEDGLSYWEYRENPKTGKKEEVKIAQFDLGDCEGREVLVFFAKDHEYQDNIYYNEQRLLDYGFQNREASEGEWQSRCCQLIEEVADLEHADVHAQAFPEEQTPSKLEKLKKDWFSSVKTVAKDKYPLYVRHHVDGISINQLVEERFRTTGKRVSNQSVSDMLNKISKKAYKDLTGEEMPKLRNRKK